MFVFDWLLSIRPLVVVKFGELIVNLFFCQIISILNFFELFLQILGQLDQNNLGANDYMLVHLSELEFQQENQVQKAGKKFTVIILVQWDELSDFRTEAEQQVDCVFAPVQVDFCLQKLVQDG